MQVEGQSSESVEEVGNGAGGPELEWPYASKPKQRSGQQEASRQGEDDESSVQIVPTPRKNSGLDVLGLEKKASESKTDKSEQPAESPTDSPGT